MTQTQTDKVLQIHTSTKIFQKNFNSGIHSTPQCQMQRRHTIGIAFIDQFVKFTRIDCPKCGLSIFYILLDISHCMIVSCTHTQERLLLHPPTIPGLHLALPVPQWAIYSEFCSVNHCLPFPQVVLKGGHQLLEVFITPFSDC
jgi:hypothetical protein